MFSLKKVLQSSLVENTETVKQSQASSYSVSREAFLNDGRMGEKNKGKEERNRGASSAAVNGPITNQLSERTCRKTEPKPLFPYFDVRS